MDEYNGNTNFSFEPMDEASYRSAPQADGSPEKPKRKKRTALKIVAIVLAAAIVGGFGGAGIASWISGRGEAPVKQENYTLEESPLATTLKTNTGTKSLTPAEVYAMNVDAVVGISTESTTTNIFGQASSATCSGTGFVLTADGYVVTNYHVIENANSIKVTLYSGDAYDAKLVGGYSDNDVALLKIDAKDLKCVTVGKSKDLVVGEQVVAIGNPLGELTYTMTSGYVSALDREINTNGTPINMLQTDVAINSGNSGGPLFDMNGNVVAITSAKYSGQTSSGAYIEGLSFAIPIDDVLDIIYDLQQYGYVTGQPYLGVKVTDMDSSTADLYKLPVGPYVNSVEDGSCAKTAGVQEGDIIIKLGDTEVKSYTDLVAALNKLKAGDVTTITVYRGGQEVSLNITLDEKDTTKPDETVQQPQQEQQQGQDPYGDFSQIPGFGWFFGN